MKTQLTKTTPSGLNASEDGCHLHCTLVSEDIMFMRTHGHQKLEKNLPALAKHA